MVEEASNRKAVTVEIPSQRPGDYYGIYVFNRKQMKEYMRLLGEMNRYKYIDGYVWYVAMEELEKVE